jgi:Ca2+/Na+ antiporter
MPALLWTLLQFLALTGLIIVVARFLLYQPAKGIAHRLHLGNRAAGQLLGYLTSVPELVTTIAVAAAGFMSAVAFNILSSNIINVLLAMGAATAYRGIRDLGSPRLRREHVLIGISIVVPIVLLLTGQVESVWVIPVFIVGYVAYLVVLRRMSNDSPGPVEYEEFSRVEVGRGLSKRTYLALNGAIIALALVGLYFLGDALGGTVHELGTTFGVPQIVIGLIMGVVTSLPELTTFVSSYHAHRGRALHRATEEVTHNVLASNASNLLIVQTVGLAVFLLVAG